jgi:hypothetical protein
MVSDLEVPTRQMVELLALSPLIVWGPDLAMVT